MNQIRIIYHKTKRSWIKSNKFKNFEAKAGRGSCFVRFSLYQASVYYPISVITQCDRDNVTRSPENGITAGSTDTLLMENKNLNDILLKSNLHISAQQWREGWCLWDSGNSSSNLYLSAYCRLNTILILLQNDGNPLTNHW